MAVMDYTRPMTHPAMQDTRAHAELAKEHLDMKVLKGRPIRVRHAVHGSALRIKELSPFVSNELLESVRVSPTSSIICVW